MIQIDLCVFITSKLNINLLYASPIRFFELTIPAYINK